MFAAEFGTGQVFWSMLWFFLFCMWIWLLVSIFADIFRSSDLSGWGKAGWTALVIFLPLLGVFTYLIARGQKMTEHATEDARQQEQLLRAYVHDAAATAPTEIDQLAKLASLKAEGVIDDAEYQRMKQKLTAA